MSSYSRHVLNIASEVPYSSLIYGWSQTHGRSLNKLIEHSRRYERPYLAWEAVRKVRNPFFVDGTGFEGYYVGYCHSPQEIVEQLLLIGHEMLTSNCRLYRYNYRFRSRLMKTLLAEMNDAQAIEIWSAQFGATLGRLRCNLPTNMKTRYFQAETYQSTSSLPSICYAEGQWTIEQKYAVPCGGSEPIPRWAVNLESSLKPSDIEACIVIKSIGKFGHPLIREYLDEQNSPEPTKQYYSFAA